MWAICGVFFVITLCCCSRIQLAVAIMKVTSSFINGNIQIIAIPLIFLVLTTAWMVGWTFLAVWIMSVGEPKQRAAPLEFMTEI